jgi:hypothetical protein
MVAGGVDWLALLTPLPLLPPPHAATAKTHNMLMPAEADARLGKMQWKFMRHSIKVENADHPHEYRSIKNWFNQFDHLCDGSVVGIASTGCGD